MKVCIKMEDRFLYLVEYELLTFFNFGLDALTVYCPTFAV